MKAGLHISSNRGHVEALDELQHKGRLAQLLQRLGVPMPLMSMFGASGSAATPFEMLRVA